MGQYLPTPNTEKHSGRIANEDLHVGYCSMQGWRTSMEDAHTILFSMPEDPEAAFFAVFDGHGGPNIAQYASQHMAHSITSQPKYIGGDIVEGIRQGFLHIDEVMREEESLQSTTAGSTAISILLKNDTVYCANVGDSRAIAVVGNKVQPLSHDHKPTNYEETQRIHKSGGWIQNNRVNGNLALSRALGDYAYKNRRLPPEEHIITANPELRMIPITDDLQFIVLACDGVWDVVTNEEVAKFVSDRIQHNVQLDRICEQLVSKCMAPDANMGGLGQDNMTVIIVEFLHHSSQIEELGCTRPSSSNSATPSSSRSYRHQSNTSALISKDDDNDDESDLDLT